jgi:hypothetical protein
MIRLYGCNAAGANILSIDDTALDTDQGAAFTASLRTAPFDAGLATGWSTLREFAQVVSVAGTATVTVTPLGDGAEYTDQAQTHALTAAAGEDQLTESPLFVPATRFQAQVAVTAHSGRTELGEADQVFIPRRSGRAM